MPDETLIATYGLEGALLIYFGLKELWPWVRDKFWPQWAAERRADQVGRREADDRLFKAFEGNTQAMAGLQTTLNVVNEQIRLQTSVMQELNEDVAGLYGFLQQPRPSRKRTAPQTQSVKETAHGNA
jgi:hypothetical protein